MSVSFIQDPNRVSPRWEDPDMVAGFKRGVANENLLLFASYLAEQLPEGRSELQVLDIGAGAGRNAIPLARLGHRLTCVDLSSPMLEGLQERLWEEQMVGEIEMFKSPMAPLPFEDSQFDLVIAHGVWNLSKSDTELRHAVAEAARVASSGAGLFVFTFSRHTIPQETKPYASEQYIYTEFGGEPQCFLRESELIAELEKVGFACLSPLPLTEYNCPPPPYREVLRPPAIYEAMFRMRR